MKLYSWCAAAFCLCAALAAGRLVSEELRPGEDIPTSRPASREDQLRSFLKREPRNTEARIELGLLQESSGRVDQARATLLEAARLDHQHAPAWTLANFYFRHPEGEQFWRWARETARLNYDDVKPLLRLASATEPDPQKVLARLGDSLAYPLLDVLIGREQFDRAQQLSRALLAKPSVKRDSLIDLTTRELAHGDASYAGELWTLLHENNDPLAVLPDGQGFRPRLANSEAVPAQWSPGEIRFPFEGEQSDAEPLLEQSVVVRRRASRYTLRARVEGAAPGLYFSLDGIELPATAPQLRITLPTASPARDPLRVAQLRFYYRRPPGSTALRGDVLLRDLKLLEEEPVP